MFKIKSFKFNKSTIRIFALLITGLTLTLTFQNCSDVTFFQTAGLNNVEMLTLKEGPILDIPLCKLDDKRITLVMSKDLYENGVCTDKSSRVGHFFESDSPKAICSDGPSIVPVVDNSSNQLEEPCSKIKVCDKTLLLEPADPQVGASDTVQLSFERPFGCIAGIDFKLPGKFSTAVQWRQAFDLPRCSVCSDGSSGCHCPQPVQKQVLSWSTPGSTNPGLIGKPPYFLVGADPNRSPYGNRDQLLNSSWNPLFGRKPIGQPAQYFLCPLDTKYLATPFAVGANFEFNLQCTTSEGNSCTEQQKDLFNPIEHLKITDSQGQSIQVEKNLAGSKLVQSPLPSGSSSLISFHSSQSASIPSIRFPLKIEILPKAQDYFAFSNEESILMINLPSANDSLPRDILAAGIKCPISICASPDQKLATDFASCETNKYKLITAKVGQGSGDILCRMKNTQAPSPCQSEYLATDTILVSANPLSNAVFAGWRDSLCSGSGECQVAMSGGDKTVSAQFDKAAVNPTSCPAGQFLKSANGTTSCISCPAGSFCTGGTDQPRQCAPGKYSPGSLSSCYDCEVDYYSASAGASQCNKCDIDFGSGYSTGGLRGATRCWLSGPQCASSDFGNDATTASSAGLCVTGTVVAGSFDRSVNNANFIGLAWTCSLGGQQKNCWSAYRCPGFTNSQTKRCEDTGQVSLAVTINGVGTVTSDDSQIDCPGPKCSANFTRGTPIILRASPTDRFENWTSPAACGSNPVCSQTLSESPANIVANFKWNVKVAHAGSGDGSVTSNTQSPGISCVRNAGSVTGSCLATYSSSVNTITLTAAANAQSGSQFVQWSTGPCASSESPTCAINRNNAMDPATGLPITITAEFGDALSTKRTLTINKYGTAGKLRLTSSDGVSLADCGSFGNRVETCTYSISKTASVTLTPQKATSSTTTWRSNCDGTNSASPCVLAMSDHRDVRVDFSELVVSGIVKSAQGLATFYGAPPASSSITFVPTQQGLDDYAFSFEVPYQSTLASFVVNKPYYICNWTSPPVSNNVVESVTGLEADCSQHRTYETRITLKGNGTGKVTNNFFTVGEYTGSSDCTKSSLAEVTCTYTSSRGCASLTFDAVPDNGVSISSWSGFPNANYTASDPITIGTCFGYTDLKITFTSP